jgi:hypothetical protein
MCGCGFRFGSGGEQRALAGERALAREAAWRTAGIGGALIVVGLVLTLASFVNAKHGPSFILYGMVGTGGIWLARGLGRLRAIDQLPPIPVDEPSLAEEDD